MINTAILGLQSAGPYSQSRMFSVPKPDNISHDKHEQNTWRERMHVDDDMRVFIPGIQIRTAIQDAAQFLKAKIPGQGRATYSSRFNSGIAIVSDVRLPLIRDSVRGETLAMSPTGKRGPGPRVLRIYPFIPSWEGKASVTIVDDLIDPTTLLRHADAAGLYIGIGRWRPSVRGMYGRFTVASLAWNGAEMDLAELRGDAKLPSRATKRAAGPKDKNKPLES